MYYFCHWSMQANLWHYWNLKCPCFNWSAQVALCNILLVEYMLFTNAKSRWDIPNSKKFRKSCQIFIFHDFCNNGTYAKILLHAHISFPVLHWPQIMVAKAMNQLWPLQSSQWFLLLWWSHANNSMSITQVFRCL